MQASDREALIGAATEKACAQLTAYAHGLARSIAADAGLPEEDVAAHTAALLREFLEDPLCLQRSNLCAWFTRRGDSCHKDRRPGCDFCSTHADLFRLHAEEIERARQSPGCVNVTRKGIQKAGGRARAKACGAAS